MITGTVPPYVKEPEDAVTVTVAIGRVTLLVACELIGPYELPLPSVQRRVAVSVRSPGVWVAGTVYLALAVAVARGASEAGTPLVGMTVPAGRVSVRVRLAAGAEPLFVMASE